MRNVELIYPYVHDGEAANLAEAVDIMGRLQLGRTCTPGDNAQIVAFLESLTGERPRYLMPILPPSSEATPGPRPFE